MPPEAKKTPSSKKLFRHLNSTAIDGSRLYLVLLIGLLLVVYGAFSLTKRHQATTGVSPLPNPNITLNVDSENPEEKIPDGSAAYNVPAENPRRIIMPQIGALGYIQPVGLNSKKAVTVPSNIHIAGWFTESVRPGQPGLSVIDGHVSGRYSSGIFKNLANAEIGSQFTIEFGNLTTKTFEIIDVVQLPEAESAIELFSKEPDVDSQLNLITCGGNFNRTENQYPERIIVKSVLKN